MTFTRFKTIIAAALVVGSVAFLSTSTASATTVYNDSDGATRATLTCTSCSLLLHTTDGTGDGGVLDSNNVSVNSGAYGFDTEFGELFFNSFGSSEANEALWINSVLGSSFVASDLTKSPDNDPDWDGELISSSALYVILKVGQTPDYTILLNTSGGEFSFTWNGTSGTGTGLSHYTEIGAIPIPAAGFLLIGALGGLVALRRRRKTA